MKLPYRFLQDQRGATTIEYAAIAVFLSIVIVAVVTGIGSNLKTKLMGVQFPGT
jgi:pilus assembly protein Flp/PilA